MSVLLTIGAAAALLLSAAPPPLLGQEFSELRVWEGITSLAGWGYIVRPPEGAPFIGEFVEESNASNNSAIATRHYRVFQDSSGRQRIGERVAVRPIEVGGLGIYDLEFWLEVVFDWPSLTSYVVTSVTPLYDGGPLDPVGWALNRFAHDWTDGGRLDPWPADEWLVSFPGTAKWKGDWPRRPESSSSMIEDMACEKPAWRTSDGAGTATVFVAKELGYPIRQKFEIPEGTLLWRATRLERKEPPAFLFQPPDGLNPGGR